MKYLAIRITIALFTFVIGLFVTAQVNRAAYYIWPDVDPQPKVIYEFHEKQEPCVRIFVEKR
jgi:hypothetical protein